MRLPQGTIWRCLVLVAVTGLVAWGYGKAGLLALFWAAPLVGATLGMLVVREKWRSPAIILGAAMASACFWAAYALYSQHKDPLSLTLSDQPWTEATGGAVVGVIMGVLLAVAVAICELSWLAVTTEECGSINESGQSEGESGRGSDGPDDEDLG